MNPWDDLSAAQPQTIRVFGVELRKGDRVRLWPRNRADIFDLALEGKQAVIETFERTFEGEIYVAVTVDDDPGRDLGELHQVGHRFFFRVEEIEPLSAETAKT